MPSCYHPFHLFMTLFLLFLVHYSCYGTFSRYTNQECTLQILLNQFSFVHPLIHHHLSYHHLCSLSPNFPADLPRYQPATQYPLLATAHSLSSIPIRLITNSLSPSSFLFLPTSLLVYPAALPATLQSSRGQPGARLCPTYRHKQK